MALIVGATSSHGMTRRHGQAEQLAGIGDHLAGRSRQIVGDVVDRAGRRACVDRGQHRGRDVLDMDAREDLAGLVDAPRGAGLHLVDGAAAGTVDAGQPEDVDGAPIAHRLPGALGRQPLDAARLAGLGRRRLVDPVAAVIAIDAGGREIAQPARVAQHAARRS